MNEETYLIFDQYLQDELLKEEKIEFEKELAENQELADAFAAFKDVNAQLEVKFGIEEERNAFVTTLQTASNNHFNAPKSKLLVFRPWMYMAAASVALLFGVFVFNSNSQPSFEDYNQYENAYFTERGEASANIKKLEIAFNEKKYQDAIPLFETLLKENKTAELNYYYGIALLETNRTAEADIVFNELQSGSSVYKNKATWSLALSKLKQKDYQSSKKILLTIPSDYEDYDEVQKLLKELD